MQKSIIRSVNFNEDFTCFTCCPENGVLVFNVNPLAYLGQIDGDKLGSLSSACVLGRSNIFALVGGGKTPKFAENAVIIWDEARKEFLLEYAFSSPVLGLLLRKNCLVVLLQESLQIFDFPGQPETRLAALDCWPAGARGLASLAGRLLAFPARGQAGCAQLVRLDRLDAAPVLLQAHRAPLAALQLSRDGDLLATAGTRGTLVRLFDTASRRLLRQLRRGSDPALLHSLAWCPGADWVCATSDKGTVHVWSVGGIGGGGGGLSADVGTAESPPPGAGSPHSMAASPSAAAKFLPDLAAVDGARADVSFALPPDSRSAVAFTGPQSVVALTLDGAYHRYSFTQSCASREAYDVFTDMALDSEFC